MTRILHVTSASKGKRSWTELAIYHEPEAALPFRAEIVGDTSVAGQVRRTREKRFGTLAKALNWSAFDFDSLLYKELRQKALIWLEEGRAIHLAVRDAIDDGVLTQANRAARSILAAASSLNISGEPIAFITPGARLEVNRIGFDGAGGLAGAITWLYGDYQPEEIGDPLPSELLADDFGIQHEWVQWALELECGADSGGAACAAAPGVEEWRKGFIAALAFFDREAFHANRIVNAR